MNTLLPQKSTMLVSIFLFHFLLASGEELSIHNLRLCKILILILYKLCKLPVGFSGREKNEAIMSARKSHPALRLCTARAVTEGLCALRKS